MAILIKCWTNLEFKVIDLYFKTYITAVIRYKTKVAFLVAENNLIRMEQAAIRMEYKVVRL